ncbi:MAG: hypothetical protein MZV65_00330 [Chromatiales bacterium]|nr:hypothetical protein [Chromatiales bacterium]
MTARTSPLSGDVQPCDVEQHVLDPDPFNDNDVFPPPFATQYDSQQRHAAVALDQHHHTLKVAIADVGPAPGDDQMELAVFLAPTVTLTAAGRASVIRGDFNNDGNE